MSRIKLGEICHIVSGSTPKTSIDEYWDGDKDWITPAELTDDSYIVNESVRKITELGVKKTGLKPFPRGTVILSSRAPIGKVAIAGKEMYCNQGFKNLICSDEILPEYLYWFLKGNTEYLNSLGRGATFKEISKKIVSDIEINVPDIGEQKNAVDILERCWTIIRERRNELDKLDELIKARFVEMFGDPIDNKSGVRSKPFSECCLDMHQGINTVADKVEYQVEGYPIIQSKNITKGYLDLDDVRYLNQSDYDKYREKYNPQVNDLLICNIGTIGKSYIVMKPQAFLIAWNLFLVKLDLTAINPIFAKTFIELLNEKRYFDQFLTGGTVKFINKRTMGSIPTPVPTMSSQNEFANFVKHVDKSKVAV